MKPMLSVYHNYDGKLYVKDIPAPTLRPNEVMVKIVYSCICDDELQLINGGSNYFRAYPAQENTLQGIGHEASGIVVQSCPAARAAGIFEGAQVTIHPNIFCGKCVYCLTGRENLCIHRASTMRMMREYVAVDYSNVYPLNGRISLLKGSLVQPIACVLHAIEKANIHFGQSVLVVGNNFAAIVMIMLARQRGAKLIATIGMDDLYLSTAKQQGADYVFSLANNEDMAKAMQITNHIGYDVVLEASWMYLNKEIAMGFLGRGGTIVYFSQVNTNTNIYFNAFELFWKEATIRTAYGFPYSFDRTIDCIRLMDLDTLTNNIYPISDIQKAYKSMLYGNTLKAIIKF